MKGKIAENVFEIGVYDKKVDLFEGQYPVPQGISYNSYYIKGEKTAVIDTVDAGFIDEWLANIDEVAADAPDYLVVQHMEPDHSAGIRAFADKYPTAKIVGNAKTFAMIEQFFDGLDLSDRKRVVTDGEVLELNPARLHFVFAPMVHWPEVMLSYDATSGTLFSADAFGRFGMESSSPDEARRYFIGIVGKYGAQVQSLLKKAAALEINRICPLHGPILTDEIPTYVDLYDKWSSYRPEEKGVTVAYTSVYGNTAAAANSLIAVLTKKGVTVKGFDLARCDITEAVASAFRYDTLVLASPTYNGDMFPFMRDYIHRLAERNFKSRRVAFIENGSWAPLAAKVMRAALENCKELQFGTTVTVRSAVKKEDEAAIKALAKELAE